MGMGESPRAEAQADHFVVREELADGAGAVADDRVVIDNNVANADQNCDENDSSDDEAIDRLM